MNINYHRVYAKVDLDAIKSNVEAIREHVNRYKDDYREPVRVMAVIKADGYGHGAIPIGRELEKQDIDYIAVAIYQEGVQLRKEGIRTPILVLGNTPWQEFHKLVEYDLTQTVYSLEMGMELEDIAKKCSRKIKIHLKIDTGMGRIGIRAIRKPVEEVLSQVKQLHESEYLDMEGIFTHFSKADEFDKTYTNMQIDIFDRLLEAMEAEGIRPQYIHASNSAGLIDMGRANYNMVRAGISIYGLYPSEEVDHSIKLRPALSIISRVVFVKDVEEGEAISYGGIYITDRPSVIATIPIGYADGYSRALSNKGQVIIHGQYAPVVGRVCMDQILVDVTDIDNVRENDEVYLIGTSGDANISVEDLARHMQTINYEVICLIGKRVPRVYVKGNEVVETIDYF